MTYESTRKKITDRNEDRVRTWFEESGFVGVRLDTGTGNSGKRADWQFTKDRLTVICEVKTVFSGGQFGLRREQWERQHMHRRRRFDEALQSLPQDGVPVVLPEQEYAYLFGDLRYPSQAIFKEQGHSEFEEWIRQTLSSDPNIARLPFQVTISIDGLYTPHVSKRPHFIRWLKEQCIERVEKVWEIDPGGFHKTFEYPFENRRDSPKAFVQIMGPYADSCLEIGFIRGGSGFNEDEIETLINDAVSQLSATRQVITSKSVIPIIALCSESQQLRFNELFREEDSVRYNLLDWSLSKYQEELAAIILLDRVPRKSNVQPRNFWEWLGLMISSEWVDFGYLLTSPYREDIASLGTAMTTEHCQFAVGLKQE